MPRQRPGWTNPLTRMKVKQQLALLFLILVGPVFVLNYYANLKAEQILKRHVTNAYLELNKQNDILINRDIDTISRIMNTIIQNPVTQSLQPMEEDTLARVRKYETADQLLATYPLGVSEGEAVMYFLYIYDPQDRYSFAPQTSLRFKNRGVFFYTDQSRQPWMEEAAERKGKGYLRIFDSTALGTPRKTLAYVRAVNSTTEGNKVIGVLIATNVHKKIQQSLQTISLPDDGEIYVTDYDNRILASSLHDAEIGERLALPSLLVTGDEPEGTVDAIQGGYIYVEHYNYENQRKLIYKIPTFSMLQQQNELKRVIQLISFVYAAFAMAVMAYFWRSLLTPMQRLAAFTRSYEPGKRVPSAPAEGRNDEVGVLIHSVYGMASRLNALIEDRYLMEIKQKETQLQILYQQINPHLLYNTLESIYWKSSLEGRSESAEMIKELALLMKIGLSRGRELITLAEELEHARAYMALQQMRYDYEFKLTWRIDERAMRCLIPKITLQPLLENAILHGVRQMGDEGEIALTVRLDGDGLADEPDVGNVDVSGELGGQDAEPGRGSRGHELTVGSASHVVIRIEDNGYAPVDHAAIERLLNDDDAQAPSGYGIRNVHQRIRLHYGDGYGLRYASREGGGTVATIVLPAREDKEEERHV